MKKILALFCLAFLLSSCGFFSQKEEVPVGTESEKRLEKMIGIVQTQQELNEPALPSPFSLILENGGKIAINSLSVNLKRYAKRRVEIEGKWNDAKTVFDVINVTSLGQETQQKELFQDSKLGIKFMYPSVWVLSKSQNVLGISTVRITPYEATEDELAYVDTITIERSENNRKLSVREWLGLDEEYRSPDPLLANIVFQQSSLGAAQLPAVKKTAENGKKVEFFAGRDTFMYHFSHVSVESPDKDFNRNAFYDLVQSFEFIPFDDKKNLPTQGAVLPETAPKKTLSKLAEENAAEKAQKEANQKIQEKTLTRDALVGSVKTMIGELAPEPPSNGNSWNLKSVDFVYPEGQPEDILGIYAVYSDTVDMRRILLSVTLTPDAPFPAQFTQIAYFKPGETTDWLLVSGTDSMKTMEKMHITADGGNGEISIKKGMSLLDARSFKIKIQYPSNWYWANRAGGYSFSDKPVTGDNVKIHLTKAPETLPNNMVPIGNIGGKPATRGTMAEVLSVCVQGSAKYCLSGDSGYEETMKAMFETLQE